MTESLPDRSPAQDPSEPERPPLTPPSPCIDPNACDFCHGAIATDALYQRLTIGLNSDGESPFEVVRHVEEVSELLICSTCQKTIEPVVDRFLETLWQLRAPHPSERTDDDAIPPTVPDPGVLATPLGFVQPETATLGSELLAVAARAYPPSPAGFALGVAIGRMLSEGTTLEQLHGIIDHIVSRSTAALEATGAPS